MDPNAVGSDELVPLDAASIASVTAAASALDAARIALSTLQQTTQVVPLEVAVQLRAEVHALKEELARARASAAALKEKLAEREEEQRVAGEKQREQTRVYEEQQRLLGQQRTELEAERAEVQRERDALKVDAERQQKERATIADSLRRMGEYMDRGTAAPQSMPTNNEPSTPKSVPRRSRSPPTGPRSRSGSGSMPPVAPQPSLGARLAPLPTSPHANPAAVPLLDRIGSPPPPLSWARERTGREHHPRDRDGDWRARNREGRSKSPPARRKNR